MKPRSLFIVIAILLLAALPGLGKEKSSEKLWKEHREAGRKALEKGRHALALQELELALKAVEQFEPEGLRHVEALSELAAVYVSMRRYQEAEPLCERALASRRGVISLAQLPIELHLRLQLCDIYKYQDKLWKAEPLLLATQTSLEKQVGAFHPSLSHVLHALGGVYLHQKQHAKAEETLEKALQIAEAARNGPSFVADSVHLRRELAKEAHIATILNALGLVQMELKNHPAAEKKFLEAVKNIESNDGKKSGALTAPLLNLTYLYLAAGNGSKAALVLQRAKKIAEKRAAPDHPIRRDIQRAETELARQRSGQTVAPSAR